MSGAGGGEAWCVQRIRTSRNPETQEVKGLGHGGVSPWSISEVQLVSFCWSICGSFCISP